MNIAALLPHLDVYGGVRRYIEMGNEFVRRGHVFTIFHSDGSSPKWLPYAGTTAPISEAKRIPQDVVFCGDSGQLPLLSEVPAKLRIMEILGPRYAEKYRQYYRPEFVVIGLQSDWKQYLEGIPGYTIGEGIDTTVFRPVPVEKDVSLFRVCAFGRIRKAIKGTRFVIKAVKQLKDKSIHLVLFDNQPIPLSWWATRGVSIETVINPSRTAFDSSKITFAEMYSRCDVFVNAELSAGWSNTTSEAMACGLPVICTKSGTIDFAFHEKTALVVPMENPDAIASAIRRLINDHQLRKSLGEAGRMEIQKYAWTHTVNRLLELFEKNGLRFTQA